MNRFKILSCAAMLGLGFAAPGAQAQGWNPQDDARHGRTENLDRGWHGDRRDWEPSRAYAPVKTGERRLSRRDTVFRGRDGRAYCRRSDGTTGLVVGAVGGAILAKLAGGRTLESLAAAGGGALLGRELDRGNVTCR
ncbi:hypothetical protein ACLIMP_21385 [Novosphingobium aerophilum]|uniref:hypothetical protein n=1 Tax=Novosphingobium TaxID=165696 RepID=UPI002D7A17E8|nr:hypothetical protein [Novosphingobium sp. RL4]WRT95812.1 hypothetical protein U9J33_19605 [Novosphingobium sp. RL4]